MQLNTVLFLYEYYNNYHEANVKTGFGLLF